jgi:Methyltransferase domain
MTRKNAIGKKAKPSAAAARGKAGYDWLSKLRCPACGHPDLAKLAPRPGDWGAWGVPGLRCPKCRGTYPVEKGGILRLIPRGDYSRYAYWDKLHSAWTAEDIAALYKKRFAFSEPFLLSYYAMPRLARRLGWKAEESLELGCQWGSNSLTLQRLGVTERVWLLDISVTALKGAARFFKQFGVTPYALQAEIHRLPFKDAAMDLTLSGGLYEHFVGEEQEQVVDENCRVSKRVLCQVPESSAAYWIYRRLYSLYKGGWPFGFEVPVSWARLKALFTRGRFRVAGRDWHDLVSAARMVIGDRRAWARVLTARPFFFYLFRHDAVIAVEREAPGGPVRVPDARG